MIQFNNLTPVQKKALDTFPSYQSLLKELPPQQLLVTFDDISNIEQSLSEDRLSLDDMCVIYPNEKIPASVDYLSKWLDYLNRFSNINKVLTEVKAVAHMISKTYGNLYLSDLKVIFERIMRAEYGVFYNSVDAQRIMYSFMQYSIERNQILSKKRVKFALALEKYIDGVKHELSVEVNQVMKEKYSDLSGPEYWQKKNELSNEIVPERVRKAKEEFTATYREK